MDCQFPKCHRCDARPEKPIQYQLSAKKGIWLCPYHRYPPCNGCGAPKPIESITDKNRFSQWTCETCKATKAEDDASGNVVCKSATEVTANNVDKKKGSKKGPKEYNCVECPKRGPLKDFYAKPCHHPHEPYRCLLCAFPKCHNCPFRQKIEQGNEVDMQDKEKEEDADQRPIWYCKQSKCQGQKPRICANEKSISCKGKPQPSSAFNIGKDRHLQTICKNCQKPTCHQCGEKYAKNRGLQMNNPGWIGDGYWYCDACRI